MQTLLLLLWANALPALPTSMPAGDRSLADAASEPRPASAITGAVLPGAALPSVGVAVSAQDGLAEASSRDSGRPGWYLGLYGGFGQLQDGAFDEVSGGVTSPADGSYDSGFLAGFSVGRRFDERWSAELDYTYRSNDVSGIDLVGGGSLADSGDYASVAILANLRYDFLPGERWRPYVGLGVGFLQEIDADLSPAGVEASERGPFAFQAMAGASFQVDRHWSLFAEARYLGTGGADLEDEASGDVYEADYDHLGVVIGARYGF
jgi:opacity protein-like surface antigen